MTTPGSDPGFPYRRTGGLPALWPTVAAELRLLLEHFLQLANESWPSERQA